MKHLVSLLVLLCLTSFVQAGGSGQGATIHTLVIDPGHGGLDPGAIGPGGHHEADLALGVSLKFGEMVHKLFPDIKIIYTRTTDKFVSLADRADIANKAKADLFICIHLNSATNHDAYGTSTYVLGLHRTDDNLEIAKRENAVIELEGDKDKNYEFDPNSPEGHIIMSMKQNAFLDQSILIASKIEDELALLSKRKSRGVKQAGFWVLYKTAMPALLAEIGFISNPQEEQYLSTAEGQSNIATSICKAFSAYKYQIEGKIDTSTEEAKQAFQKKTEKQNDSIALKALQNPHPAQASGENKTLKETEQPKPTAVKEKPGSQPSGTATAKKEDKAQEDHSLTSAQTNKADEKNKPAEDNKTPDKQAATADNTPKDNDDHTKATNNQSSPVVKPDERPADLDNTLAKMNEARMKHDSLVNAMNKGKIKDTTPIDPNIKFTPINQIATTVSAIDTAKVTKTQPEKKLVTVGTANQIKTKEETKTVKTEPKETKTTTTTTTTTIVKKEETKTTKPVVESPSPPSAKETMKPTAKTDDNVTFNLQLIAGVRKPANYQELVKAFGILHLEEIKGGVIRYMAGPYGTYSEAKKANEIAKKYGYEDAFIMAYQDGKRTTPQRTSELAKAHP